MENNKAASTVIPAVQEYIRAHVCERITLSHTAKIFGISPNYLSALFAQNSEMGFNDFVNYIKIERAKEMLNNYSFKIYEISDFLGYNNAFYFSRVFKKFENLSPYQYANQNKRK